MTQWAVEVLDVGFTI